MFPDTPPDATSLSLRAGWTWTELVLNMTRRRELGGTHAACVYFYYRPPMHSPLLIGVIQLRRTAVVGLVPGLRTCRSLADLFAIRRPAGCGIPADARGNERRQLPSRGTEGHFAIAARPAGKWTRPPHV